MKQLGFFDVEERLARLSGLGDQLEAFSRTVDFEVFRSDLEEAPAYSDSSKGGCQLLGWRKRDPMSAMKAIVLKNPRCDY